MRFKVFKRALYLRSSLLLFIFTLLPTSLSATPSKRGYESGLEPWGADQDLSYINQAAKNTNTLTPYSLPSKTCQGMIRFFQTKISPVDGPRSHYIPSSSQYTLTAIQRHGVLKGIALGCDRLMRENSEPWVYRSTDKYGIVRKWDPVPSLKKH
jgi:uncharacterized protein